MTFLFPWNPKFHNLAFVLLPHTLGYCLVALQFYASEVKYFISKTKVSKFSYEYFNLILERKKKVLRKELFLSTHQTILNKQNNFVFQHIHQLSNPLWD